MNEQKPSDDNDMSQQVATTRSIWGAATGMLGISIPLCAITHSGPVIPIIVMGAAAVSTMMVWVGSAKPSKPGLPHASATQSAAEKRVLELEERLANLEAITNFEHKLLDKKYPGAAPVPAAPAFTFESPVQAPPRAPISPPMPVDSGAEMGENARVTARPIAS